MLHEFDAWLETKYLNRKPARIAGHGTSAFSRDGVRKFWDIASGQEGRAAGSVDVPARDSQLITSTADDDALFAIQPLLSGKCLARNHYWSNHLEVLDESEMTPVAVAVTDHDLGYLACPPDGKTLLATDETGAVYCFEYIEPASREQ